MKNKRTKEYYQEVNKESLCQCAYCQNYYKQVENAYPQVAKYLDRYGIDIKKAFETMPLEVDEEGFIEYISAQYIVFGSRKNFKKKKIGQVEIDIAESHPSTEIIEEYFIVQIYPIKLRWDME